MTDLDRDHIWCRFRRPLGVFGPTSVNPQRASYHFYFKGPKNDSGNVQFVRNKRCNELIHHTGIFLPSSIYRMNLSPRPYNITEFYTDVQISNDSTDTRPAQHFLTIVLLTLSLLK